MANDCIGQVVEDMVSNMPSGGVLVLENLRFHHEVVQNDPEFAKQLASLADLYVNDCVRNAYKPYASTERVVDYLKPAVAGLQMKKELHYLFEDVSYPDTPFVGIVGGSKLSAKIGVIDNLLDKRVNHLLLGGGLIFTFFKAQEGSVGSSLVEEDMLGPAESLYMKAARRGVEILFPADIVAANWIAACAEVKDDIDPFEIPDNWIGVDIGRKTIDRYSQVLDSAKTIIWSGPMGLYKIEKFSTGTKAIAEKLAGLGGRGVKTIIAGADTVAAIKKMGLAEKMTHISMGEYACLQLLEGIPLPAMLALDDDPVEKVVPEDESDDDHC
ncbi:phosphoglycerate kinase, cytosolic [Nicotiana attenuata]|uniref:Phosphoglycerate kinase n=2 Tax=Nicotiana attenuata TaxID=49451 RepID=A0A1J6KPV3_NICAT|nr:phosphoglycerate kinase, cytosolic [Nicotiana attenuata]